MNAVIAKIFYTLMPGLIYFQINSKTDVFENYLQLSAHKLAESSSAYTPTIINNNYMINSFIGPDNIYRRADFYGSDKNFRNSQPVQSSEPFMGVTSDWLELIKAKKPLIKIALEEDGIYRIAAEDLRGAGIDILGIDPRKLNIYLKGREYPIFVHGESDGKFDPGDYVEFYGSRNYSGEYRKENAQVEPYHEYLDRYSDTTFYWLTWDGNTGIRIDTSVLLLHSPADTLKTYTHIDHYETNNYIESFEESLTDQQLPFYSKNKTWFAGILHEGMCESDFSISDFVPGKTAKIFYKIISYAADVEKNAHHIGLQINDNTTLLGETFIDRGMQKMLTAEFESSILKEGKNTIRLILYPNRSQINAIAIDWFDVEYPRKLNLPEGGLPINFTDSIPVNPSVLVITTSSSEPVVIYKTYPKFKRFYEKNNSNSKIKVFDSVSACSKYYAAYEREIKKPKIYAPTIIPDLAANEFSANHVIITHPDFLKTAMKYSDFISREYDITSRVFNVFDIYNRFNFGFISAEAIRDFLRLITVSWKSEVPESVMIIGDANYDSHNYKRIENYSENFVPSFGYPVSDNWYVIGDSLECIPQIPIGRIPVRTDSELRNYFEKVKKYSSGELTRWNKTHVLISGGKSKTEKTFCKSVNDGLIERIISPAPVGGLARQFYSTNDPPSNFGPFDKQYVDYALSAGGLTVSYVGHSGTNLWDNGIDDVSMIGGSEILFPLISDFGCSTGKFAEPDITSFSEEFVIGPDGRAIAYLGNSSLGFISTSGIFPGLFYEELFNENNSNIGEAHVAAKKELVEKYGLNGANKVFLYCNTLIGDPVIRLKIPDDPNLIVSASDIILPEFIDENSDSVSAKIIVHNLGKATGKYFGIKITDSYSGSIVFSRKLNMILPLNDDSLNISIPVCGRRGEHVLRINLDCDHEVDELNENDNLAIISYEVSASGYLPLIAHPFSNKLRNVLKLISPVKIELSSQPFLEIDSTNKFTAPYKIFFNPDTFCSTIALPGLKLNERFWFRINAGEGNYSPVYSFVTDFVFNGFSICDSLSFAGTEITNVQYDKGGLSLADKLTTLKIVSDGSTVGGAAKLELNGMEYAYNPFGCGFHILIINSDTKESEDYRWFNYWNQPDNLSSMTEYLKNLQGNKIIITAIGGKCGGYGVPADLTSFYESLGSRDIKNVNGGASWIFAVGIGSQPLVLNELYSDSSSVNYDTNFVDCVNSGSVFLPQVANAGLWRNMKIDHDGDAEIIVTPVVYKEEPDTMQPVSYKKVPLDLGFLNEFSEKNIRFIIKVRRNESAQNLLIKSIDLDFQLKPDLTISEGLVSLIPDTVLPGQMAKLSFVIANSGETPSGQSKIKVDQQTPDNSVKTISVITVDSLYSMQNVKLNTNFVAGLESGLNHLKIYIDAYDEVNEFSEGNNFCPVPFYIKPDTTLPDIRITFDGEEIIDGDLVSPNPVIKIEVNNNSFIALSDTNVASVYIDNNHIFYSSCGEVKYSFLNSNPQMVIEINRLFEVGSHTIEIRCGNIFGSTAKVNTIIKSFKISDETMPLDVYNYPNPFGDFTYFTFRLASLPETLRIKIYTVAGRLIKELKPDPSALKYDFNRISWDGRDEDGDLIGSGVYIYKLILTSNGKSVSVTQKLAIVR